MTTSDHRSGLLPLAALFLKLGLLGFGGPAAHIAMMEDEVVHRRGWLKQQHFLDLVGATNLIPGPNSTEMAIHVGYTHAGWPGLILAGAAFIAPAFLITLGFAWAYVRFGSLPQAQPFLFGIRPAVIAVIMAAVFRLGRTALKDWKLGLVGAGVGAAALLGVNAALALLLGGVLGMIWLRVEQGFPSAAACLAWLGGTWSERVNAAWAEAAQVASTVGWTALSRAQVSLWQLALFFLKVGSVLYGSGYVLVAFLEGDLVHKYGWLTQSQLLDAISVGQFTPGPVLSTSAFIGYLLAGANGAVISAVAIFLPSFFFVAGLNPLIPKLRQSVWASAFLDAVNISAVALMGAVTIRLGVSTLTSATGWGIFLAATLLGSRWKVSPSWLVLGGALVGLLRSAV